MSSAAAQFGCLLEKSRYFSPPVLVEREPRPRAAFFSREDARVDEDLQVMACRGLAQVNEFGEVTHARFTVIAGVDGSDELESCRICERFEQGCERFGVVSLKLGGEAARCAACHIYCDGKG